MTDKINLTPTEKRIFDLQDLAIGTRLGTKDGRRTGNAIVTSYDVNTGLYNIHTDFGNNLQRDLDHIKTYYHILPVVDIDRWFIDRARLTRMYVK